MYIYIDESGLFSTSDNENSWSSVGAIVIPDESLEKVENALNRLKQVNKLNNSEELKRIAKLGKEKYDIVSQKEGK